MTRLSGYLLIAMMLLTFVGQSVASVAMVCDMPHASMQMDHHANMSADSDMSDMDCCHEDVMVTAIVRVRSMPVQLIHSCR